MNSELTTCKTDLPSSAWAARKLPWSLMNGGVCVATGSCGASTFSASESSSSTLPATHDLELTMHGQYRNQFTHVANTIRKTLAYQNAEDTTHHAPEYTHGSIPEFIFCSTTEAEDNIYEDCTHDEDMLERFHREARVRQTTQQESHILSPIGCERLSPNSEDDLTHEEHEQCCEEDGPHLMLCNDLADDLCAPQPQHYNYSYVVPYEFRCTVDTVDFQSKRLTFDAERQERSSRRVLNNIRGLRTTKRVKSPNQFRPTLKRRLSPRSWPKFHFSEKKSANSYVN